MGDYLDFSITQTLRVNPPACMSVSPLRILGDTRERGQELMLAQSFCVCNSWPSVTVLPRCRMNPTRVSQVLLGQDT